MSGSFREQLSLYQKMGVCFQLCYVLFAHKLNANRCVVLTHCRRSPLHQEAYVLIRIPQSARHVLILNE